MATIRFIREDLEVQCNPGENLRELVMKENLQLYGLKGILGNCGGAGCLLYTSPSPRDNTTSRMPSSA